MSNEILNIGAVVKHTVSDLPGVISEQVSLDKYGTDIVYTVVWFDGTITEDMSQVQLRLIGRNLFYYINSLSYKKSEIHSFPELEKFC